VIFKVFYSISVTIIISESDVLEIGYHTSKINRHSGENVGRIK
jgi:hypothetical protein